MRRSIHAGPLRPQHSATPCLPAILWTRSLHDQRAAQLLCSRLLQEHLFPSKIYIYLSCLLAELACASVAPAAMQINRLPVVDGEQLVGVITRHDVLKGIYDTKTFL